MSGAQQCAPPTTISSPTEHQPPQDLKLGGYFHHVGVLPASIAMVQTYRVLDATDVWAREQGYRGKARPAQTLKGWLL